MSLYVLSWNMQGWSGGTKRDALNTLVNNYIMAGDDVVVLLQECGTQNDCKLYDDHRVIWNPDLTCVNYQRDPTAKVDRCSLAILVSNNITRFEGNFKTLEAGRVMLYFTWNGVIIATIHAPAKSDRTIPYVKRALDELRSLNKPWLLMGDFNSDPSAYNLGRYPVPLNPEVINAIQYEGATTPKKCDMIYSRNPTQGERGTRTKCIDFAFMDTAGYFHNNIMDDTPNTKVKNTTMTDNMGNILSDHNLIGLKFA